MKVCGIMGIVLLAFAASAAALPYAVDFSEDAGVRTKGAWQRTANSIRSGRTGSFFVLTNLPPAEANTRLSFDVRCFWRNEHSRGAQHFGVYGKSPNGINYVIRSLFGKGMDFGYMTPDGVSMRRSTRNAFANDYEWQICETNPLPAHVEADLCVDHYALRINGTTCHYEKLPLPGVSTLEFKVHGFDVEVSNMRFDRMEARPPAVFRDKPSFVVPDDGKYAYAVPADLFNESGGGFMYWTKFENGMGSFRVKDAAGRILLSADFADVFEKVSVAMMEGKAIDFVRRFCGHEFGDTFHIAFTWRPDGSCRFFLNGQPYTSGISSGERFGANILGNALRGAASVEVMNPGSPSGKDRTKVSELQFFARPIKNHEVLDAYRAKMPIDAVLEDSMYSSEKPVRATVNLAPGGYYMRPRPVDRPDEKATVRFETELVRKDVLYGDGANPKKVTGWRLTPVPGSQKDHGAINVSAPVEVAGDPVALAEGTYLIKMTVNGRFRRSREITVTPGLDFSRVSATDDEWKTCGVPICARMFQKPTDFEFSSGRVKARSSDAGDYVEVETDDSAAFGRVSTVLPVPSEVLGKPLLLEITWPDDALRYMGFYLYPENPAGVLLRDRLQAGVMAGGEFRSTGKMQTSRYLVFAAKTNMLFEVRTMAKGMPGAVAKIKLSRLKEPLPRLKLNLPDGFKSRSFGFSDEDQTFFNNLNGDLAPSAFAILGELMRYFHYTGQNSMQTPLTRYFMTLGPVETCLLGVNPFPPKQGQLGGMFRLFAHNGFEVCVATSVYNVPDIAYVDLIESCYREEGCITLDKEGQDRYFYNCGSFRPNIANSKVIDMVVRYCADEVNRFATNGISQVYFGGIGAWQDLTFGYDDWTFSRFFSETGLTPPAEMPREAKIIADFKSRYTYLAGTNSPVRADWLAWRARKVTEFYRGIAHAFTRTNPELELVLGLPDSNDVYADFGIDRASLAEIHGVRIDCSFRMINNYRWRHFRGEANPPDLKAAYRELYDMHSADPLSRARADGRSCPMAVSGGQYHETFLNTLCPKRFSASFQDADVKPWGRHWLKELAFLVAKGDALSIYTGQQPLGTLGHEAEAREFAKAYRALPALPFADAFSDNPNVIVRSLRTKNGLYFYCVNLSDEPQTVRPAFLHGRFFASACRDLSSGAPMRSREVALKPYELRSFLK